MLPTPATLDSYGGLKQNDHPVEDITTDEDAGHRNEYASDTAGMTHTAARAWRRFIADPTTPGDPVSNIHDAVWGDANAVKPTVANAGTGLFDITWPTTITDALGNTKTLALRWARAFFEGGTAYVVSATITGANTVRVRVWNSSFALNNATGVTFLVEVG